MHYLSFILPVTLRSTKLYSDGGVKYDAGSGWKPEEGGMQSTDTPDFFYEEGDPRNAGIQYTDGMMGSTGLDKLRKQSSNDPGVAGALDVDPTKIGGYQVAAKSVKFELDMPAKMGRFLQEINVDIPAASDSSRVEEVVIKPVCMAFEDFYAGFTDDSDPCFSVTPTEGRMDRRGGQPSVFDVEIRPNGQVGQRSAYLCVVLPEEDEQFTVKLTANFF